MTDMFIVTYSNPISGNNKMTDTYMYIVINPISSNTRMADTHIVSNPNSRIAISPISGNNKMTDTYMYIVINPKSGNTIMADMFDVINPISDNTRLPEPYIVRYENRIYFTLLFYVTHSRLNILSVARWV